MLNVIWLTYVSKEWISSVLLFTRSISNERIGVLVLTVRRAHLTILLEGRPIGALNSVKLRF